MIHKLEFFSLIFVFLLFKQSKLYFMGLSHTCAHTIGLEAEKKFPESKHRFWKKKHNIKFSMRIVILNDTTHYFAYQLLIMNGWRFAVAFNKFIQIESRLQGRLEYSYS